MAKVRVITHPKSNSVLLENIVNGKPMRLSTGKKANARTLVWYNKHKEEEFWKLYYDKFGEDTSNSVPFRDYAKMIVDITKGNRNQFSQRTEVGKLKRLNEFFGDMMLSSIKPTFIQQWQSMMLESLSPKTVIEYRSTLNVIFEFAIDDELISKNPIKRIKPPKKIRKEVEIFDNKDRDLLLENSTGQLHNLIKFAFFSGLRAGEITGLKWEHIDFETKKIRVCNRMRCGTEALPKGYKIRVIDLLPQAEDSLLSQREKTGLHSYVFLSRNGVKYNNECCITQSIKAICEKINIKVGGLQMIRKSHNTMLKRFGFPIDWILHQMGHENDEVNRNHYTGLIEVDREKLKAIV